MRTTDYSLVTGEIFGFGFLCGFPLNEERMKANSLTTSKCEWTELAGLPFYLCLFVKLLH